MKQLILHIGTGKTGTSHIQSYLFNNRKCLRKRFDADFLDAGLTKTSHFGEILVAHYDLVNWIKERNEIRLQDFSNKIRTSNHSRILISCENLYHALDQEDIAYFKQYIPVDDTRVVCYVRRQDEYIESAYKQQVKIGRFRMEFARFLENHTNQSKLDAVHTNYPVMIGRWRSVFGRDSIRVRLFGRSHFVNGRLLDDFFHACGMDDPGAECRGDPSTINPSLPTELISIIRFYNYLGLVPQHQQEEFVEYLRPIASYADAPILSYDDRVRILHNYEEINRLLMSEYCAQDYPGVSGFDQSDFEKYKKDKVLQPDIQAALAKIIWNDWSSRHASGGEEAGTYRRLLIFAGCIKNYIAFKAPLRMDGLLLAFKLAFSDNFQPDYYLSHYSDVMKNNMNPLFHFLEYGFAERRHPAPWISSDDMEKFSSLEGVLKFKASQR